MFTLARIGFGAKCDFGAQGKSVHDAPESVFTMGRNQCSQSPEYTL